MAVYTNVTPAEAAAYLDRFDIGAFVRLTAIQDGIENSNYRVDTETGPYILTLFEKRTQAEDLPFFCGLMEHLAATGLSCPRPIAARDGTVLGVLNGRAALLVTFLPGASIQGGDITPAHCAAAGAFLAELHIAARGFQASRANAMDLRGWRKILDQTEARATEVCPDLWAGVTADWHRLAAIWPQGLPAGVLHADFFPDNLFFDGGRVSGVIDFYFACNDALVYDLVIALGAWCFDATGLFLQPRAAAMVQAYHAVRPLQAAEIDAFPILAQGASFRFLVTRLYDWLHPVPGALVVPKDPMEYVRKLEFYKHTPPSLAALLTESVA
jgi:homoserine kinase type II